MANVKVLSDDSLKREGFSGAEIAGASSEGYVGEKNGVKYFRSQQEMNLDLGESKTREVKMPDQMGDRTE